MKLIKYLAILAVAASMTACASYKQAEMAPRAPSAGRA